MTTANVVRRCSLMVGAALVFIAAPAFAADDPLTKPIATSRTAQWLAPRVPARVHGNTYLVGFAGLSVALIDTGRGLILVDGALPQSAEAILSNVRKLGLDPRSIKYILSSEPHFDHSGGFAALVRATGATVLASSRGAEGLRTGRLARDDPQYLIDHRFPPVPHVRAVRDGERLRLGDTIVTAHATPGHTMGSMTWSWRTAPGREGKAVVFAASLNPASADAYRYSAATSRPIVAAFQHSYRLMKALPCEILITSHPDWSDAKRGFDDTPGACRVLAEKAEKTLSEKLAAGL